MQRWGLISINTGEGKGKTTAALGTAIRAAGRGKRVVIIYFDKGGMNYGERRILDALRGYLDYHVSGFDRINPKTRVFRFGVTEEDRVEAARGLTLARELAPRYDFMVLDEINSTVDLGMLPLEDVLDFLQHKPEHLEVMLTGRNCPKEILEMADLVTEMSLVKHYFYEGVTAREGVEY